MTNDPESVKAVAMKKRVSIWVIAAACALLSSCSAPSRESPPEIRWRFKGTARFADPLSAKPSLPDTAAEETSQATTTERDGFLPLMLFDGMEYEAAPEDADILRELMRSVAIRRTSQPAPPKASSDTESSNHAVIVGNGDTRASLYGPQVEQDPFKYVGFMKGVGPRPSSDGQPDIQPGYCTCVKMINHAVCVTAAHCVNTGPAPEDPSEPKKSWRPMSNIKFLATADGPMETLDANATKYAAIIPKGYLETSSREYDFAVLRFRGDVNPMVAESDPMGPPVPQVPFRFFDMGANGYARNGPEFLDLAIGDNQDDIAGQRYTPVQGQFFMMGFPGPLSAPPSCQGRFPCLAYAATSGARGYPGDVLRLHYAMDATGGMSGGPVFLDRGETAGSSRYRVVAIHSGVGQAVKIQTPGAPDQKIEYTNAGVLMTPAVDLWLTWAAGGAGRVFTE